MPQRTQTPQRTQPPTRSLCPQRRLQPSLERPPPFLMSNRRYFNCWGLGHIASNCPKQRIITLAKWDAVREEDKEEEQKEDEEEE